jgi:hypothetical protein
VANGDADEFEEDKGRGEQVGVLTQPLTVQLLWASSEIGRSKITIIKGSMDYCEPQGEQRGTQLWEKRDLGEVLDDLFAIARAFFVKVTSGLQAPTDLAKVSITHGSYMRGDRPRNETAQASEEARRRDQGIAAQPT